MNNPYRSPSHAKNGANPATSRPISLVILACALLLTLVFATINTIEEEHPLAEGGAILILIACVSQLPGLLVALWRWKRNSVSAIPMLFGAYLIALTGSAVYAVYAFNGGPADSLNSAAHMHVIFFPVLHCIFAAVVYLACGILSAVLSVFLSYKQRDEQSHAPEPAAALVTDGTSTPPAQ